MHLHHLSRSQKLALTLLLTIAIMLPLILLLPRYFAWEERRLTQEDMRESFTASVSDSFAQ